MSGAQRQSCGLFQGDCKCGRQFRSPEPQREPPSPSCGRRRILQFASTACARSMLSPRRPAETAAAQDACRGNARAARQIRPRRGNMEDHHTWQLPDPLKLRNKLDSMGCSVGGQAAEILARPAFMLGSRKTEMELVLGYRRSSLGSLPIMVTLADIYGRARQLGFELAPAEVGPQLRMQYLDQPIEEFHHRNGADQDVGRRAGHPECRQTGAEIDPDWPGRQSRGRDPRVIPARPHTLATIHTRHRPRRGHRQPVTGLPNCASHPGAMQRGPPSSIASPSEPH